MSTPLRQRPLIKLKIAVVESGMRHRDVAEEAGITPQRLSAFIAGREVPSAGQMEAIAWTLGRNIEELFSED